MSSDSMVVLGRSVIEVEQPSNTESFSTSLGRADKEGIWEACRPVSLVKAASARLAERLCLKMKDGNRRHLTLVQACTP